MGAEPTLIVITGPTASGKSALAVAVARALGTEIISADSRQIFRGIPIATAVPTPEERMGVTHHLLETLPLEASYSASDFEADALRLASGIIERTGTAVVCGGSMLYVDALCHGMDDIPAIPPSVRTDLTDEWQEKGDSWLLRRLHDLDPLHFERVDRQNLKRVFHAVEVSLTAGRPYSSLLTGRKAERPFRILKICLGGNRTLLFGRINARAEEMVRNGLVDEAREVAHLRSLNSLNTVGLKEMFGYLDGSMTLRQAVARMQKNTRVYAKKQITWHKRDSESVFLDFAEPAAANRDRILARLRGGNPL